MLDEGARDDAVALLMDADLRGTRRRSLTDLSSALTKSGDLLRTVGWMVGSSNIGTDAARDPSAVSLGYVANTAGSLLRGASLTASDGNTYATAALLRQTVEVEYLAWAFAEDRDEASAWLNSTRQERLGRWQPRHLRERSGGRFRGADYASHCERGGHPTPLGCRALLNGPTEINIEGLIVDALLHGRSTWQYIAAAADEFDVIERRPPGSLLSEDFRSATTEQLDRWWQTDPVLPFIDGSVSRGE